MSGPRLLERLAPWSVALLAILLLAPFVGLDPARGVTFSNAPFSDEAWNLVGARNIILFGQPSTDEWQIWPLALPFTVVESIAFALFGIKLVVARLVIVAVVALTGAAIARMLGGVVGSRRAWVAGAAYVTCGLVLYYGRLVFVEPLVGAFLAAGILSLVPAARDHALRWGVVGGTGLALAVMTKGIAIGPAAAVVLVVLVAALRWSWARRWLAGAVPAAAAIALAWGVLVLWPNRDAVATTINTIYPPIRFPTGVVAALRRLAHYPFTDGVLWLAFPLLLLALAGGVRLAASLRRASAAGSAGSLVAPTAAAAALVAGLGLLGLVSYQPNRYVVALLPAAAILAAWSLPARLFATPTRARIVPLALAILAAAPGVVLQIGWLQVGGTEVARMQELAGRALPAGATISGQYAPLVALGAPVRTVVPFNSVNGGDLYAAGVRYIISVDAGPAWTAAHPAAWAAREMLGCMTWGVVPTRSCIYRLPDPAPAPAPDAEPAGPAATATAADVAAAAAAVDSYTRLLVKGDWSAAYALLSPASRDHWGSLANFTSERAAYFKSVAGRYTVSIPASAAMGSIRKWLPETYGTPLDLGRTVLVEVDYPALAGNNAGFGLYLVAAGSSGLLIFDVR